MTTHLASSEAANRPFALAKKHDQAGDYLKAVRFYRLAGETAFKQYEYETALTCFNRALKLTPEVQFEVRYTFMYWLERIYSLVGQPQRRCLNLTDLAALADVLDSDFKRAEVAARLTLFKLDSGENEDVISIARLAVRLAQIAKASAAEADLHIIWGRALQRLAEYDAAQQQFQKALALASEFDLKDVEANCYRYMGVVDEENGRYSQAKTLYKQALALYETTQDRRGQSDMLNNLGKIAYDQGAYTTALRYWDHAKSNYLEIDDKPGSCRIMINQSTICMDMADYTRAKELNDDALKLSREIGLRLGENIALINLALAYYYLGDQEAAALYAKQCLTLSLEMKNKRLEGFAHQTLGRVQKANKNFQEATDHFWEAVAIWHEIDQSALLLEAEAGLADVALEEDNIDEAAALIKSVMQKLNGIESLNGTENPFEIYLICHHVLSATNDNRAETLLQEAHEALIERADAILDETSRNMFLEKVMSNSKIIELFTNKTQ